MARKSRKLPNPNPLHRIQVHCLTAPVTILDVALNGMTFDLSTSHGRMMATFLSGIAEFERDLISEQVKSGLAAAKARGKKLGRQPGERPTSDRLRPKVMALVYEGRRYRWIACDLGISKNTVLSIVKRTQSKETDSALRAWRSP